METEDEDEEQEDALKLSAVSAAPARQTAGEEDDEPEAPLAATGEAATLERTEALSWAQNQERSLAEPQKPAAEMDGLAAEEKKEMVWEALWRDELAIPVRRQNGATMLRSPGDGDVELEGPAGARMKAEPEAVWDSGTDTARGLESLYRETVRAARPAAQTLPVEQAGRTLRAEEPGRTAALTVDELDRAVRRDSRRYDGGMTIY